MSFSRQPLFLVRWIFLQSALHAVKDRLVTVGVITPTQNNANDAGTADQPLPARRKGFDPTLNLEALR